MSVVLDTLSDLVISLEGKTSMEAEQHKAKTPNRTYSVTSAKSNSERLIELSAMYALCIGSARGLESLSADY